MIDARESMEQAPMTIEHYLAELGPIINGKFEGITADAISRLVVACTNDYTATRNEFALNEIATAINSVAASISELSDTIQTATPQ